MAGCIDSVLPWVTSPVALGLDPSAELRFVNPKLASCRQKGLVLYTLLSVTTQATDYWQHLVKNTYSNAYGSAQAFATQDVHDKHARLYDNAQNQAVAGLAWSKQHQHCPFGAIQRMLSVGRQNC